MPGKGLGWNVFGYIRPQREELKIKDDELYRAAYCGLCRRLGKRYGLPARFFVNYDMTFLWLLLSCGQSQPQRGRCFCPANPLCRKDCVENGDVMDYVADVCVILSWYKLRDNIADEPFFKGLPYRLACAVTGGAFKKAKRRQPEFDSAAVRQLKKLALLEKEQCASIDRTADAFAGLLSCCAGFYEAPEYRRPLQQVLYHVGRFLYLTDALDDLEKDCKKNQYNPLRFRFAPQNGRLTEEDQQYLINSLENSVTLSGAAFALLPARFARSLLENILYLGMPATLKLVCAGQFHKQKKMRK